MNSTQNSNFTAHYICGLLLISLPFRAVGRDEAMQIARESTPAKYELHSIETEVA